MSYDGIGRNVRNGLNFTERGYGIRGAVGVSDRGNTAASQLRAKDVDWDYIFGKLGVRWLHTGGIFAALSETSAQTVIAAVKKAKEYGTVVSYDLNYRPSLWKGIGGQEKAQQVNREIAKYIDVMIGNEEDFTACLGLEVEGNDAGLKKLNVEGYCKMIENAVKVYPNFKVVATTLRTVKTATVNDWSAICWADGKLYEGMKLDSLEIFDRVGGGALLAILANSTDTNIIARSSRERQLALTEELKALLAQTPYPDKDALAALDDRFIAENLSPGGSADLLALTYLLHFITTEGNNDE